MKRLQELKAKAKVGLAAVVANVSLTGMKVSAGGFDEVSIKTGADEIDPIAGFNSALGVVVTVLRYVGVVMMLWGIYELAMGFTQEGQANKKVQGFMWLMAGFILVAAKFFLRTFGIIA